MSKVTCTHCFAEMPEAFSFCGYCGTSLTTKDVQSTRSEAGDLRDVTILFADLSGFTALSEHLSPEQVRDLMDACFEGLGGIVTAHGGHIDKYIGDSIMALFGAPIAHDDDPLRAAEAALAMQAFMRTFSSSPGESRDGIAARIGLNCGTVFAGAMGASARRDYSVLGDAVNLASRLESAAEPGTILTSADFKRRVDMRFAFGPPRSLTLKGKARAVEAYELLHERSPSLIRHGQDGEPFVGRHKELEALTRLLGDRSATRRWIEIRGPLGLGKTRLANEALANFAPVRPIFAPSSTATARRPFTLLRRLLQTIWRDLSGEPQQAINRDGFFEVMRPLTGPRDRTLDAIWYVAAPDNHDKAVADTDTLTFRLTIESGVGHILAALAAHEQNYILFLDSFDQADDDTRDVLKRAYESAGQPLPAVITTVRGDAIPARTATDQIDLGALDNMAAHALVQALTGSASISEQTQSDIVTRGGGVPLFICELVRAISEDLRDAPSPPGTANHTIVPGSLLSVMVSRLDRLDPFTRRFLAICSVQGPEFSLSVSTRAWALTGGERIDLDTVITTLSDRQLITATKDDAEQYLFTQVLMHNACYEQLLQRDRRHLHRSVAAALCDESGSGRPAPPETLAHHYECAEQWLEAADHNVCAGDQAAEIFANSGALMRYARALKALEESASHADPARAREIERGAHGSAARVCLRVGNYPSAQSHAARLLALSDTPVQMAEAMRLQAAAITLSGDLALSARILTQAATTVDVTSADPKWTRVRRDIALDRAEVTFLRGHNHDAANLIREVRRIPDASDADRIRVDILEGRIAHANGQFDDASRLYSEAYNAARHCGSLSEEAAAANYMGNAARDAGRYAEAETSFRRALDVWTQTGKTESIAGAHNNLANLAMSRGDDGTASHHYGQALTTFKTIGHTAGCAIALMNLAILANERGNPTHAITCADEALGHLRTSGNQALLGVATVIKGEAQIEAGLLSGARATFESVLTCSTLSAQPLAIAGAQRGMGRVALALGEIETARQSLDQAVAQYAALRRVQEEARTKLYLAQALGRAGRHSEAASTLHSARQTLRDIGAERDLARSANLVLNPSAQ
ncbi:MAG: hypothetical protein C0519_01255 [Hyphomicrobium sp.]|nr:hypothetical protein [Hyphomicrobium sp.]PPD09573.1 MAG: hypothetical protein CTY28_01845 [Hyphomicrobium sp.]